MRTEAIHSAIGDRVRLPLAFDVNRLQRDLQQVQPGDWVDHFVQDNYRGSWRIAPLRAPVGAQHPIQMIYSDPGCTAFRDTPILKRCPYFREVLTVLRCDLHAVRLMSLAPGSRILEHCDHDLCAEEGMVRLHIPITTGPGVEFFLNDKRVRMHPGECWYLRLSDPHRVSNNGATLRIHLVIDAPASDWLRSLLQCSGAGDRRGLDPP